MTDTTTGFALPASDPGEALATPARSELLDRDLFALFAEWQACAAECDRLYPLVMAAEDRFEEAQPPLPDALRARPSQDDSLGLSRYTSPYRDEGRWFCWDQVEKLRSAPRRQVVISKPVPEDCLPADAVEVHRLKLRPEAQARADEIVAAWDRWRSEVERAAEACGLTEVEAAYQSARDKNRELRRQIVTTPARSVEGVLAKAAVCGWCGGGTKDAAEDLAHDLKRTGPTAEALASAMALDLMRLAGVPEDGRSVVPVEVPGLASAA